MSNKRVLDRLSDDQAVIITYQKELEFLKETKKDQSWWQLRDRLDLKAFYREMNHAYNLYRLYAPWGLIEELEEPYKGGYSLDTFIRICHLSPYIFYEPEDFHRNYELLEHYINEYKPLVDDLVKAHILGYERRLEYIPF